MQNLLDAGVEAICYKPFDNPGLLSTVERLFDPARARALRARL